MGSRWGESGPSQGARRWYRCRAELGRARRTERTGDDRKRWKNFTTRSCRGPNRVVMVQKVADEGERIKSPETGLVYMGIHCSRKCYLNY